MSDKSGMVIVDGVYYTPDDLARKRARDAKAAESEKIKNAAAALQEVDPADLEKMIELLDRLGTVEGRLDKIDELVAEVVDSLGDRLAKLEGDPEGDPDGDPDGGAPEVTPETAPEPVEPAAPAKAPAARKGGAK